MYKNRLHAHGAASVKSAGTVSKASHVKPHSDQICKPTSLNEGQISYADTVKELEESLKRFPGKLEP